MVAKRDSDATTMTSPKDTVIELSFLISRTQFDALESAANSANLSVAQYLRRLVQSSIEPDPATEPVG